MTTTTTTRSLRALLLGAALITTAACSAQPPRTEATDALPALASGFVEAQALSCGTAENPCQLAGVTVRAKRG